MKQIIITKKAGTLPEEENLMASLTRKQKNSLDKFENMLIEGANENSKSTDLFIKSFFGIANYDDFLTVDKCHFVKKDKVTGINDAIEICSEFKNCKIEQCLMVAADENDNFIFAENISKNSSVISSQCDYKKIKNLKKIYPKAEKCYVIHNHIPFPNLPSCFSDDDCIFLNKMMLKIYKYEMYIIDAGVITPEEFFTLREEKAFSWDFKEKTLEIE